MPIATDMDLTEFGSTGLEVYGGHVREERHGLLRGSRGVQVYREMGDNDPVVGAILYVIESLCRQIEWRIEPARENDEAALDWAEFVDGCRTDLSTTWEECIAEALSCVQYGWSYFEVVYKLRRGPDEAESQYRSRYSDGRVGWHKLASRSQDSLERWQIDDDGGIRGMYQRSRSGGGSVWLPIEKCLLFRPKAPKNNPEGRSLLRSAFRPYRFVKRLEELEAIGIERELAGLPVVEVPSAWLSSSATAGQKSIVSDLKSQAQQIRRDEREAAIIPAERETDASGKEYTTGFRLRLLTSGGSRQIQPDVAIRRHQSRMAMSLLAQWLLLGQDAHGSFALAASNTNLFAVALGALLDAIAAVFNTVAIPRLMRLNDVPTDLWPRLVHGDIEDVDLAAVAAAVNQLVGAGVIVPDQRLERKLREMAGLPQPEVEEVADDGEFAPAPMTGGKDENVQAKSLNGAQVASMLEVVSAVAAGQLPRDSGLGILQVAFQLGADAAEHVMGDVGRGFVPTTEPVEP